MIWSTCAAVPRAYHTLTCDPVAAFLGKLDWPPLTRVGGGLVTRLIVN